MQHKHVGLIGLGVMGFSIAQNFANHGVKISVFNRSPEKTKELAELDIANIIPTYSIEELISSLPKPRLIHLMIASEALDTVLLPLIEKKLIEKGDVIIDLGNSNWQLTQTRQQTLSKQGIHFVGCGVSGGAEGALLGPSMMPGGDKEVLAGLLPIYEHVAAKDFEGKPCVTNIGSGAAGHYVKMVHNGIEYAIMQVIAELYGYLTANNYTITEIKDVIDDLNSDTLSSYLLEITSHILETKKDNQYLIKLIDPVARGLGTGKWTVESALDLGVPIPSIVAAVQQRYMSNKSEMIKTANELDLLITKDNTAVTNFDLTLALETVFRLIYLQGLELISHADKDNSWGVSLSEVVRIWQGGCIIRSALLKDLLEIIGEDILFGGIKETIAFSQQVYTPIPVIHATLNYGLSLTSSLDEMSLIQAQRDYFGQHTYNLKGDKTQLTGGWAT